MPPSKDESEEFLDRVEKVLEGKEKFIELVNKWTASPVIVGD